MTTAVSPGKIILFGEHAVVYGQPAIAVPVTQVAATAVVETAVHDGVLLSAPDLGEDLWLHEADPTHPLAAAVWALWQALPPETAKPSHLHITVTSTIPIASGLGSGAAIAAALIRALAQHIGRDDLAQPAEVSRLTYEVERIHHGTPSGIDNTVVSYQKPVNFVRDLAQFEPDVYEKLNEHGRLPLPKPVLETFQVGRPMQLFIADTGIKAPTKDAVGDVRNHWQANPAQFEEYFAKCGRLASLAQIALRQGDLIQLGSLMNENQAVLEKMTVSSHELELLCTAAMNSGALGAKLSGGGRGGNMIVLLGDGKHKTAVKEALYTAGAKSVLHTILA